jgi:two-component system, OmpR family, sensor kinase
VPLVVSLRERVDSEVRLQARAQADVVAATASDLVAQGRRADLQRLVRTSGHNVRGRVIVTNSAGSVLADSAGADQIGTDYSARPEIARALKGVSSQDVRYSATLDTDVLATAVPVLRTGRPDGAVRITQDVAAVNRSLNRATVGLVLIGVLVLLIGLTAAAVVAGQIARPVRRLEVAARRVAGGDFDTTARVEGSSEQRSLARSFNEMTDRIGRLLRVQREFVADASHQLRTPLTGLRLRLEEARAITPEPAARAEIDAALGEVDRLSGMVRELLLLSEASELRPPEETIDLGDAARSAADRWRAAAQDAAVALQVHVDMRAGKVASASGDVDRVVDVLVENAIRYAGAEATVTVAALPGVLEVRDNGPGLAPGEESEVFDRFHRGQAGRRTPGGTGLGLAIARELARRWGAEVTLASRPGGGVTARLVGLARVG